jgi:hypothetical protein
MAALVGPTPKRVSECPFVPVKPIATLATVLWPLRLLNAVLAAHKQNSSSSTSSKADRGCEQVATLHLKATPVRAQPLAE